MESIKKAPGDLRDFTNALSGEDCVIVSYVKPLLHLLRFSLLNPNDDDSKLTRLKTTILSSLIDKHQDPITDTLLDMTSLVELHQSPCWQHNNKIIYLYLPLHHRALKQTHQQNQQEKLLGSALPAPALSTLPSVQEAISAELNSYLSVPNSDMDPLAWWGLYDGNFPRVSELARKYLCIPAKGAPSERVFSLGGKTAAKGQLSSQKQWINWYPSWNERRCCYCAVILFTVITHILSSESSALHCTINV